jgi:DNA-binding response OmpR family regulator
LCVDDDPAIRSVMTALLTREHYLVETAVDGRDGWKRVCAEPEKYHVIVTDGQMPNLDGIAFIRLLREANYRGRIVVFSSLPTPESMAQLAKYRVDAIVEKGSSMRELLDAIAGR